MVGGCGPEDKTAEERKQQVEKALKRELARKKVTQPSHRGPEKPLGTKDELISKCMDEDHGAACQGACVYEHGESCHKLAMLYETGEGGLPEDLHSALLYQRKACDAGAGSGCFSLGYYYKIGKGVPKKPDRAAEFFEKSCKLKFAPACSELKANSKEKKGKN